MVRETAGVVTLPFSAPCTLRTIYKTHLTARDIPTIQLTIHFLQTLWFI